MCARVLKFSPDRIANISMESSPSNSCPHTCSAAHMLCPIKLTTHQTQLLHLCLRRCWRTACSSVRRRVHPRHRHPYGCKVHMTRLRRLHGLPAPHGTTPKDLMTSLRRLHGLPVPHGTTPKDLILAPLRRPLHRLLRPRRPRRSSGRRAHLRSCATARRSRPAVDYRSPARPARRRRRRRPVP